MNNICNKLIDRFVLDLVSKTNKKKSEKLKKKLVVT